MCRISPESATGLVHIFVLDLKTGKYFKIWQYLNFYFPKNSSTLNPYILFKTSSPHILKAQFFLEMSDCVSQHHNTASKFRVNICFHLHVFKRKNYYFPV
jgi:hypothetical protein